MTPAESIAAQTWRRLERAHVLGARLGEETLTDLLVLDMIPHQRINAFRIYHPTKRDEAWSGADLLICIRYPGGAGRRLAIQAKKLYPTGRYHALSHKDTSGIPQIDKLDKFARSWGAIPLYLLYNYLAQLPPQTHYWHCCQGCDTEQLGCTFVPSRHIRHAIKLRGRRKFSAIHETASALPWRCIFDCERAMEQVDLLAFLPPETSVSDDKVVQHRRVPEWIKTETELFDSLFEVNELLSTEEVDRRFGRFLEPVDENLGVDELTYPRRVLAVDVSVSKKERERE